MKKNSVNIVFYTKIIMPNFIEENWNKISDFRQSQALPVCDDTKCVCECVCVCVTLL